MPSRKILEMYGNGFYTKHVCRFPDNDTDEGYVNKSLTVTTDNYEMIQAIDPSHSGDYDGGDDIRGSVRLTNELSELRYGNVNSNKFIRAGDDVLTLRHGNNIITIGEASGINLSNVTGLTLTGNITAAGATISPHEFALLDGLNVDGGSIESRLASRVTFGNAYGTAGVTAWSQFLPGTGFVEQGTRLTATVTSDGEALIMVHGTGTYGSYGLFLGQTVNVQLRLYHNETLVATFLNANAFNTTYALEVNYAGVRTLAAGDTITLRTYRSYAGVLNTAARWALNMTGHVSVIVA